MNALLKLFGWRISHTGILVPMKLRQRPIYPSENNYIKAVDRSNRVIVYIDGFVERYS